MIAALKENAAIDSSRIQPAAQTLAFFLALVFAPFVSAITLSGSVTSTNGIAVVGAPVQVLRISPTSGRLVRLPAAGDITDDVGGFMTGQLSAGDYWLRVNNTTNDSTGTPHPTGYEGLYYHPLGNRPDRDPTTPITLGTGSKDVAGFDFSLREAYAVTGTVTVVPAIDYSVVDFDLYDGVSGDFLPLMNAKAESNGTYRVYGLPAGTYYVKCDPPAASGLYPVYQNDRFLQSEAIPVAVSNDDIVIHFGLLPGYTISGTVTTSSQPVAGMDIDVFALHPNRSASFVPDTVGTGTNPPGGYVTSLLPPGSYAVRADPSGTSFLVRDYYTTNAAPAYVMEDADPVFITTAGVSGIDIPLTTGGKFGGLVIMPNGSPIANADLDVYTKAHVRTEANAKTDATGHYLTDALPPDSYILRADFPPGDVFIRQYYTNAVFFEDAVPVAVTADATTTITMTLSPGGLIAGTVTDPTGQPLVGMDLDVFDSVSGALMEVNAASDGAGQYRIGALPPGQYLIRADPAHGLPWVRQYYTNAVGTFDATPVTVYEGTTTSNIGFRLVEGGFFSGTVRNLGGTPLADIDIDVFDALTGRRVSVNSTSGTNGQYTIGALLPGTYAVRADPLLSQPYVQEYFEDALFLQDATHMSVSSGQTVSGIDFSLPPGGHIDGRVVRGNGVPAAGIDIDVFDASGRRMENNASSDDSGYYVLGTLPAGTYTLRADFNLLQFLVRTYHPGAQLAEQAVAFNVVTGATNTLSTLGVPGGGAVAGKITDTNGTPLAGIDLDVFDASSGIRLEGTAHSDTNGNYVVGPFVPGSVYIRADPSPADPFAREYYLEATLPGNAAPVAVSVGLTVSNVDFTLSPGAMVSGRIADLAGVPIDGIDLDVFPIGGGGRTLDQTALSRVDGTYALGPLPEGSWAIRAHANAQQGYETRYYQSAGVITNATPIIVTGGNDITNVNFSLGTNQAPIVQVAPFAGIQANRFTLDAAQSTDANGDRLLFHWRQIAGPPVTITGAETPAPSFLFPTAPDDSLSVFELVVMDFSTTSTPVAVAVANGNPRMTGLTLRSNATATVSWSLGLLPQPYTLQGSSNLVSWIEIMTGNTLQHNVHMDGRAGYYRIRATVP